MGEISIEHRSPGQLQQLELILLSLDFPAGNMFDPRLLIR